MILKKLTVKDYRNYEEVSLSLHPMLNIFLGQNGQGKTNLLESIYYLCYGKNFRGNKDIELIRWKTQYFRLHGIFEVEDSQRQHDLVVYYDSLHRKMMQLNGVKYRTVKEMPERLSAVLFTPDDLSIIKGSPSSRRHFIDRELEALYGDFDTVRRSYERVLLQRNELLKDIRFKRASLSQLEPWNNQLVRYGVEMIERRLSLLSILVPQARKVHAFVTKEDKHFDVTYQSSIGQVLHQERSTLEQQFMNLLSENEKEDIAKGVTSIGPHRDDLNFYNNGVNLRTYGSQGQQRTAILSMKMAEISCFANRLGQQPLLLLDDVMSELDPMRQQAIMQIVVNKKIQTVISGTNLDFKFNHFGYNPIFFIKEGKISQ